MLVHGIGVLVYLVIWYQGVNILINMVLMCSYTVLYGIYTEGYGIGSLYPD